LGGWGDGEKTGEKSDVALGQSGNREPGILARGGRLRVCSDAEQHCGALFPVR